VVQLAPDPRIRGALSIALSLPQLTKINDGVEISGFAHRVVDTVDMNEDGPERKIPRFLQGADLGVNLRNHCARNRRLAEFDLTDIDGVVAALDCVVKLTAAGSLGGCLPVGIVEDNVLSTQSQMTPEGGPVLQDQVLELQAE